MDTKKQGSVALKAGVWYVISTVMVRAITVFTTPIFTRLMTTEEYGLVSTFTTWYSLLLPIFTLNLTYSIGRAKLDFPDELDNYIGSMQLLSAVASVLFTVIIGIFISPISQVFGLSETLILLLLAYLCFMPAISFAQNGYRYRYRYRQNIAISWYTILTNVGCSLLLILLIRADKTILRCIGIVGPIILLSLFFWFRSIKNKNIHLSIKANKQYWKYGLAISLPLVVHTLSLHILSGADRIFITNMCGAMYTGIYSVAYQFGVILSVVTNAVGEGWLPWFHDNYYAGNYDAIKKNTQQLVILGCYVGLACVALAPEGIALLGGASYAEGVYCVAPIVLGVVCQFIYTQYVNIELHLKKTIYVSIGTVFAAILNIVLNIIFIPMYGFVAAAYTTFASYLVLFLIHYLITRLVLHVKLYNNAFMFLSMAIIAVISIVLVMTYENNLIRYILIGIGFLSCVFVFRNYIFGFINKRLRKKN